MDPGQEIPTMTSPTDVSTPADDPNMNTEQSKDSRSRPSRLNQALAWVGVVAGGLFIVAAVFFSGFFLSWSLGGPGDDHKGPGPMACCADMNPGEQMKPGAMMAPGAEMKPGEQMKPGEMMPGGMMGPGPQSPTTTPSNTPRP
jgi:hypothetical protein